MRSVSFSHRGGRCGFSGPGRFSIDALLGFDPAGLEWGLLSLAVGLVAGGIQLATRRPAAAPHKA